MLCPSSNSEFSEFIIGIRKPNGTIAFLDQSLPVDKDVLEILKSHSVPAEQRFRFAGKCIKSGCQNWDSGNCMIAKNLENYQEKLSSPLPVCSIRTKCFWYAQQGPDICMICPRVVTEITAMEVDNYLK